MTNLVPGADCCLWGFWLWVWFSFLVGAIVQVALFLHICQRLSKFLIYFMQGYVAGCFHGKDELTEVSALVAAFIQCYQADPQ